MDYAGVVIMGECANLDLRCFMHDNRKCVSFAEILQKLLLQEAHNNHTITYEKEQNES